MSSHVELSDDSKSPILAERILEAALELFRVREYEAVTLADIASAIARRLDDVYRHYPRKERLISKLYERFATDLETAVPDLASGTIAERFAAIMSIKLQLLAPYWDLFRSLLSAALDPANRLAVLGPNSDRIRERVQGVFAAVVYGATDKPPPEQAPRLVRFLYASHLLCIFGALQDQTEGRTLAQDGVALAADMLGLAAKWYRRGEPGPVARWMAAAAGIPDFGELVGRAERLVAGIVQPPHDTAHFTLAENITRDLFRYRRLLPGAGRCAIEPCEQCIALHVPRVQAAIAAGEPVHLILPAFPAKSANPRKVMGNLPDFGEEIALRFLQERCDAIAELYAPGARLTICSDGRVFNDLVGVDDSAVTEYRMRIIEMIRELNLSALDIFDLDDVRPGESYESLRGWLMDQHAESAEALAERTATLEHHQQLYNGIHRFLTEDLAAREPSLSKNQARNQSKDTAYEVIRRSNAWSRLVSIYFPHALRLSIHPQAPHSEKIGILLTPSEDSWLTPWHGAILIRANRFLLLHREAAEEMGATRVEREGRPSHYEMMS